MQTLSMDNYEIWFIDGNSNWDGSSLASSLIPNKKLLFNLFSRYYFNIFILFY